MTKTGHYKDKERRANYTKAWQRANYHKARRQAMEIVARGVMRCTMCGEEDFDVLSIDHVMGGGHAHRKQTGGSGYGAYREIVKSGKADGYQVLCWNCQRRKELAKIRSKY